MKETGQRRDVHVRNGREMVAGLTAKRKVRIMKVECQDGERGSECAAAYDAEHPQG